MRAYESGGRALRLYNVTGGETSRLPDLLRMLPAFFPTCEKFVPVIEARASRTPDVASGVVPHQWVVEVDGATAGFYIFDYLPQRACGLTLFIALYPEFRDVSLLAYSRLAHFLIAESVRQIRADALEQKQETPIGLAVEVEVPALLTAYRQYDFVELPVVYYEPMFPESHTRMTDDVPADAVSYERVALGLFHGGVAPRTALAQTEVSQLALAFLRDFYQLPPDSMPVQQALATAQSIEF